MCLSSPDIHCVTSHSKHLLEKWLPERRKIPSFPGGLELCARCDNQQVKKPHGANFIPKNRKKVVFVFSLAVTKNFNFSTITAWSCSLLLDRILFCSKTVHFHRSGVTAAFVCQLSFSHNLQSQKYTTRVPQLYIRLFSFHINIFLICLVVVLVVFF